MKIFKEKRLAVMVMVLAVLVSLCIGIIKKPMIRVPDGAPDLDLSLSTTDYKAYLLDEADKLSGRTEEHILLYNANWDEEFHAILGVVVADGVLGDIENAARAAGESLQLRENDGLLLVDASTGEFRVVAGGTMDDIISAQEPSFVDSQMGVYTEKGDLNSGVLDLFGGIHRVSEPYMTDGVSKTTLLHYGKVIFVLLLLIAALFAVDAMRFSRWYSVYGTMAVPPVAYRPVLGRYRPGSRWYRLWIRNADKRSGRPSRGGSRR